MQEEGDAACIGRLSIAPKRAGRLAAGWSKVSVSSDTDSMDRF